MGPRLRALPSRSARRFGAGAARAWIAPNVVHHQSVPNEQREQLADGRAGQAGTLNPSAFVLFRESSGAPLPAAL